MENGRKEGRSKNPSIIPCICLDVGICEKLFLGGWCKVVGGMKWTKTERRLRVDVDSDCLVSLSTFLLDCEIERVKRVGERKRE